MTRRLAQCIALLAAAPLIGAPSPPQGWAHQSGLVQLNTNGTALAHDAVSDRLSIMEAFARWGIAYDEGRPQVIGSLFTEDARYVVTEGSATPIAELHGREEIVTGVMNVLRMQNDQRRHAMSNVVIERMESNSATALAYGIVTIADDQTLTLGASVIYTADLVKGDDGVWRFSRFVIGMDRYVGRRPQP
jgi:hypothetical protein